MGKALTYYNDNIKSVKEKLAKLEKNLLVFSTLRFMNVILCIKIIYYFYKQNSMEAVGGSFLISLILFIIVAFFHNERINSKKRLLVILEYNEKGVNEENIILEDKAATTLENIIFSKKIMKDLNLANRALIVTSDYHLFRGRFIASILGIDNEGLCSISGFSNRIYYMIREYPTSIIDLYRSIKLSFWN